MLLRVFTHPACAGCGEAVKAAWDLQQRYPGAIELRTVSLEGEEGLAEAHREQVRTIPTLILSEDGEERERLVGAEGRAALAHAVERLLHRGN